MRHCIKNLERMKSLSTPLYRTPQELAFLSPSGSGWSLQSIVNQLPALNEVASCCLLFSSFRVLSFMQITILRHMLDSLFAKRSEPLFYYYIALNLEPRLPVCLQDTGNYSSPWALAAGNCISIYSSNWYRLPLCLLLYWSCYNQFNQNRSLFSFSCSRD